MTPDKHKPHYELTRTEKLKGNLRVKYIQRANEETKRDVQSTGFNMELNRAVKEKQMETKLSFKIRVQITDHNPDKFLLIIIIMIK